MKRFLILIALIGVSYVLFKPKAINRPLRNVATPEDENDRIEGSLSVTEDPLETSLHLESEDDFEAADIISDEARQSDDLLSPQLQQEGIESPQIISTSAKIDPEELLLTDKQVRSYYAESPELLDETNSSKKLRKEQFMTDIVQISRDNQKMFNRLVKD